MLTATIVGGLPAAILPLGAAALAVSAVGFKKPVYFISVGYGFSIAALSILSLFWAGPAAGTVSRAAVLLLAAYGLRLGGYLALREAKPAYRDALAGDLDRPGIRGFGLKLAVWVTVSALYLAMFLPALSRLAAEARGETDPAPWLGAAGAAVTAIGLALETIADAQKSLSKRRDPGAFCRTGLYRFARYPNYFGEILVWTGNFLAGAPLLGSLPSWILALVGYVCIVLIMIGSARRLEFKQEERYGADPEFRHYTRTVPALAPFLPVYSLKNAKLYLG